MPKLIISIDGVVIKEVQLTQDRTTVGRRPYNDVVIDNLAVSGEHAVLEMTAEGVVLQDLDSTNGTYINGKAVKSQLLNPDDVIEMGKYRIRFVQEPGASANPAAPAPAVAPAPATAKIRVLSGASAGREVPLVKAVTTIGKPGVAVAAITQQSSGYAIAHVEGATHALLNGLPVMDGPVVLANGDTFELAGTRMKFLHG